LLDYETGRGIGLLNGVNRLGHQHTQLRQRTARCLGLLAKGSFNRCIVTQVVGFLRTIQPLTITRTVSPVKQRWHRLLNTGSTIVLQDARVQRCELLRNVQSSSRFSEAELMQ
jgi:hypothetical protein